MANRYPLQRTPWDTAQWILTAPTALVISGLLVAATVFAGGMVTGRTLTPPKVYKQVTIGAPFLSERAPNSELSLAHLTCQTPATLRLIMTTSANGYLTVEGPTRGEVAGQGRVVMELRAAAGDYDISHTGEALDWSTVGGTCTERH